MAAGSKKKKKTAAANTRGFATTSIPSKPKNDVKDGESGNTETSVDATPDLASTPNMEENGQSFIFPTDQRDLH